MGKPKLFALAVAALAVLAAAPMLAASATAAPAPERAPTVKTGNPLSAMGSDMPIGQLYATKTEADVATAEFRKAYGDKLPTARAAGQCVNSWIYVTDTVGYFDHADPNPAYIVGYLSAGYYPCRNLTLGGRYSGCGYTNANGWILIPDLWTGPIWAGFVISACTVDP